MFWVFSGCGRLSVGISVSLGTKMNHWRRSRCLERMLERLVPSGMHAIANLEWPTWWAGV